MKLESPRLTERAAGGGCACKVPAERLSELLQGVPRSAAGDERFLVGNDTLDDAAVVRLSAEQAIVQTVDVFTPIVDDPYDYGRIAATNAISDIFAMGGEPLFALAIGGFPADLPDGDVSEILRGGADVALAAGAPILGGHTITAAEPLYGLAVTGLVHPDRIWRNAGAQVGDVLVLTKALGTGIVANALRKGAVDDDVLAAAVASMTTLNRTAAAAVRELGPHAVTDVTGFGLLGHLRELCAASGVHARVSAADLPLLPGVERLARAGLVPGGSQRNRAAADAYADVAEDVDPVRAVLACDAQTSGGLLAAVPRERAGTAGWVIGEIVPGPPGRLSLA
ncbi:MAG: selenide, water dikinase [Gaiellales bacterium]|jgi:selenide,water dikinase|nr:selenide, water dikinase [Gaiellales bacterium]